MRHRSRVRCATEQLLNVDVRWNNTKPDVTKLESNSNAIRAKNRLPVQVYSNTTRKHTVEKGRSGVTCVIEPLKREGTWRVTSIFTLTNDLLNASCVRNRARRKTH
eukprot:336790_1